MSISLNTQISGNAYQRNLNLRPKISKENEILKNQIIAIGMTNPDKVSMLSRKIVMWDGSQKALDDLSAEGLNVSHFGVCRLLGGMKRSRPKEQDSELQKIDTSENKRQKTDLAQKDKVDYPITKVNSVETIEQACQEVPNAIATLTRRYQTIDIAETMTKLTTVGDLIRLSLAGSQGFNCSVPIMEISCSYQTLISNSFMASTKFVDASLQALKKHQLALLCVEKEKPEKAIEQISKTAQMAQEMENICVVLVKEAEDLCELSKKALLEATGDSVITKNQKDEIEKKLLEIDAQKKAMEERSKMLEKTIREEKLKEKEISDKADEQRNKKVGIFDTLVEGFAGKSGTQDAANKQAAKDLDNKETEIAKNRVEFQKEQLEANSKLQESLTLLKGTSIKKCDLQTSIVALEITVQTLGKIRNVFENVRIFWSGVKEHCKTLANVEDVIDMLDIDEDMGKAEIQQSALGWLALANVNQLASKSMSAVAKGVAEHMEDLPVASSAPKLIKALTEKLGDDIEKDNKAIKEIQDQ